MLVVWKPESGGLGVLRLHRSLVVVGDPAVAFLVLHNDLVFGKGADLAGKPSFSEELVAETGQVAARVVQTLGRMEEDLALRSDSE